MLQKNSAQLIKSASQSVVQRKSGEKEDIDAESALKRSGIADFIKNFPTAFIENRMIFGYLDQRSRGKIQYFHRRWCVLISAKSINTNYSDEEILQQTELPPWIDLDTFYYFKFDKQNEAERPDKKIKLFDCIEIFQKDMSKSQEKGFSFRINMGERLYHLMADTQFQRKRWVGALRMSIRTARQMQQGNTVIKKNIDMIVDAFDSEKNNGQKQQRQKLRVQIDEDIEKIKDKTIPGKTKWESCAELLKFLDSLSVEMLNIMNACLAQEPKRIDIIKEYTDYLHEEICQYLTQFWDENHSKLESLQMLSIASWIDKYENSMQAFVSDDRLLRAIKTLINIYINRSLEGSEEIIQGIINFERENKQIGTNQQGLATTMTPQDLFKIINLGFECSIDICRVKEMSLRLAGYGQNLLLKYQGLVQDLLDEGSLEIDQLIAICNNTIMFNNLTTQFQDRLKLQGGLSQEEVEKLYDSPRIQKLFLTVSNNAHNQVAEFLYREVPKQMQKFLFLDIKLDEILTDIVTYCRNYLIKLHDRFARKLWKELLDTIIFHYFNVMIKSCPKSKGKQTLSEFIEKLQDDEDYLQEQFGELIFQSTLKSCLKPFHEMVGFLSEDTHFTVQKHCRNLRQAFGPAFTSKSVKVILELRRDLEQQTRNMFITVCGETIELYNKQTAHSEENQSASRKVNVLGVDEEEKLNFNMDGSGLKDENASADAQARRASLKIDFSDYDHQKEQDAPVVTNHKQKEQFISEGYLLKKNPQFKMLEKRYFRIKNSILYWYQNQRSQDIKNKIDLSQVFQVNFKPQKQLSFFMTLDGTDEQKGKQYKFKCESLDERDQWVQTLKNEMKKLNVQEDNSIQAIQTGSGKAPLFQDYDMMQRIERAKQKALEQQKREEELEKERQVQLKQQEQDAKAKAQSSRVSTRNGGMAPMEMSGDSNSTDTSMDTRRSAKSNLRKPLVEDEQGDTQRRKNENTKEPGCWDKFLVMLGLKRDPNLDN